jgi:hypothetical protein
LTFLADIVFLGLFVFNKDLFPIQNLTDSCLPDLLGGYGERAEQAGQDEADAERLPAAKLGTQG